MANTTNESCSPYDLPEYIGVTITSVVSGFISFLASCFVISLILFFKKWRFLVQRLILYLSIATLIQGISSMIHRVDYVETDQAKMGFCVFSGFLEQQAGWMQLNAVTCITAHLFLCAVVKVRLEKLEPIYFAIIFLLPLGFNWIPFIQLTYGRAGAWCWIRSEDDDCIPLAFGKALRLVLWYVPLYAILIVLFILYIIILVKVHRARRHWVGSYDPSSERLKAQMEDEVTPIIWYPMIYFVLNLIPFVNRIHNFAQPNEPNLALWYLHALTYPLTGGFIALAFTLDPVTRKRLRWASLKATANEWCHAKEISEYPIENEQREKMMANDNEEESSLCIGEDVQKTSTYESFNDK